MIYVFDRVENIEDGNFEFDENAESKEFQNSSRPTAILHSSYS